jgi:large subunit ribosomal protein L17
MRHKKDMRGFGRNKSQRHSLLRNLTLNFFQSKTLTTTEARAKQLRRTAERLISIAKKQDLTSVRQINAYLNHPPTTRIVKALGAKYGERKGGYTRIVKLGARKGDGSEMVVIQLVSQ